MSRVLIYTVERDGYSYTGTIKEIYNHFNINLRPGTIRARMDYYGYNVNDAFFREHHKRNYQVTNPYTGETYNGSVEEIINHFNLDISQSSISNRLKREKDINKVSFSEKKYKGDKNRLIKYLFISPEGQEYYGSIPDAIKYFNLNKKKTTVYNRIHRQKKSLF